MPTHSAFQKNNTVTQYNRVPKALSGSSSASLPTSLFGGSLSSKALLSQNSLNLVQYYKESPYFLSLNESKTKNNSKLLGNNAWLIRSIHAILMLKDNMGM